MTATEEQKFSFQMEEYRSLRTEIDVRIKETFALVIYCVTAVSAVYGTFVAAVLTKKISSADRQLVIASLVVTVFFPVFGLVKSLEVWGMTLKIARYLRSLEADLGIDGWETKIDRERNDQTRSACAKFWAWLTRPPYWVFWIALIALCAAVATVGSHDNFLPGCEPDRSTYPQVVTMIPSEGGLQLTASCLCGGQRWAEAHPTA